MNFNKLLLGVVILFSVSSCQSKFGGAPEKYHAKLETSINSAGSN